MSINNVADTGLPTHALPKLNPEQQLVAEYYQHQALLCQWFATLLAAELNETTLQAYMKGDAAPLLDGLASIDELSESVTAVQNAINGLSALAQPRLELAADFASLFLSDARHSPAPYASLYLDDGRFNGPSFQRMQARLTAAGYGVDADFQEPADHVAIMLDYLAESYRRLALDPTPEAEANLALFVKEELASWLPELASRAQKIETASAFYPTLLTLIAAYFYS
ncbi:molecular chaperone TorD [Oceanisphaera pacifica]|uniref:Molecular chaperone TorD n=1 Tax=Oceanisphaera pacifica TaxID=2818389 RepID=A0ABS3NDD4_9GAMM|nr:molecular chaperone TorD [Oceanisphaera pacifica]MBO1518601.1 molecular chaperone TorD [Oceanisphaera pacifica]